MNDYNPERWAEPLLAMLKSNSIVLTSLTPRTPQTRLQRLWWRQVKRRRLRLTASLRAFRDEWQEWR